MIWLVSVAHAGWTPTVVGTDATVNKMTELVGHCPPDTTEWVARYDGGKVAKLGPVAGSGDPDPRVESCLGAGLAARPLPDGVLVKLRWESDARSEWESQTLEILGQVVGPKDDQRCPTLRFPMADGVLGTPEVLHPSASETLDAEILAAVIAWPDPLPIVPEELRGLYGDHVNLCVSGRTR
ncbi:MAG: hypothetical protein GY913_16835 [Proteobacteria bacterium]|nr:hypothetical protein [Pseudomonadota bacterium]MCP4918570.1 hypothetical protein [Pseudomonadota bacterium]